MALIVDQKITDRYAAYNSDCVEVMQSIPSEKIHLSLYSPPFGGIYTYSSSERDLSNCSNYGQFFEHYAFVVRELARLTLPGRMTAVHCAPVPSGNSGTDRRYDFPGDVSRLHTQCLDPSCAATTFEKLLGMCGHGDWDEVARYDVWKEPLAVRNRTMAKNLAHRSLAEDSSRCSNAAADVLIVLRRKGENKIPITHPTGLMDYAGERKMPSELLKYRGWTGNQIENRYSHWIWRQYASAFWDDVRIGRVLPFREAKDDEDEKHVHALQLDVIERVVTLWSNPGETVLTPFMGVGSEVYGALTLDRKGIGIELKPSYYRQALKNIQIAYEGRKTPEQSALEFQTEKPLDEAMADAAE